MIFSAPIADRFFTTADGREEFAARWRRLTAREQRTLRYRFGLADGRPWLYREIAAAYGVGRERIRQIEAQALRKLRRPTDSGRVRMIADYGPLPKVRAIPAALCPPPAPPTPEWAYHYGGRR